LIDDIIHLLPAEGLKILLTLFLCFLIGLEREEHYPAGQKYGFGGVRTFPLIGLIGYALTLLSQGEILPVTVGFAVVGALLGISYYHKLVAHDLPGVTTEVSGLVTYLIGALVGRNEFWIATTLTVVCMLLLELKEYLENLTTRIAAQEILTFTKFLLLTFVILPVVPNQDFGRFAVNPFKAWLVVVAVSGVSYGSYLVEKLAKGKGGVTLSAVLGGMYSSTFTTFVMARQARTADRPHTYAGAILIASGVMYFRFLALIAFFNGALARALSVEFLVLGAIGMAGGWLWSRIPDPSQNGEHEDYATRNPLEIKTAVSLAIVFVAMLVATNYAMASLGGRGIYALGAISGIAPVDPFIMGLTQTAGKTASMAVAQAGVLIAAASNNFTKGIIGIVVGDSRTGRQVLILLLALTVLGLMPLAWLAR
jgi:uncharacterized membrane protein (DUF4010 family)